MSMLAADASDVDAGRLLSVSKVTSIGPSAEIVDLAEWAAVRWAARRRAFFVAASPAKRVLRLVDSRRTSKSVSTSNALVHDLLDRGGGVVRSGPATDAMPTVRAALSRGPTLVVAPTVARARRIAAECRRLGCSTALYPDEWVAAASGVDVVVGARSAIWATVPDLACIVVVDEHDDTLQEERSPTWHAREVAIERAGRLGIPCLLESAVPTIAALEWANGRIAESADATHWPTIRLVDRNADDRWASSLVTSDLVRLLRDPQKRIVCVLNVKGRARAVACDACRTVARCEHCGAGMSQPTNDLLSCVRCGVERPVVCLGCGSQKLRSIRIGISRLRDELEAAAGRQVQEVTPRTESLDPGADIFVGTEAVLHRVDRADAVVFLDIDAELLAPRFRAAEQTLDLITHSARLVAPHGSSAGGEVVLQTAVPRHELLAGLVAGDLSAHVTAETERRRRLRLPPFGALAELSGPGVGSAQMVLEQSMLVEVAARDESALVRAATWHDLSVALATLPRTKQRLRIAVDPPRV
jgi:primosomal protein N' (replication factor Y)